MKFSNLVDIAFAALAVVIAILYTFRAFLRQELGLTAFYLACTLIIIALAIGLYKLKKMGL